MTDWGGTKMTLPMLLLILLWTPPSFTFTPSEIPTLRCPVGNDLRSALLFKYADPDGVETDTAKKTLIQTQAEDLKDKTDNELRGLLEAELVAVGLTGASTLLNSRLIDLASLYYGLGLTSLPSDLGAVRNQAEQAVLNGLTSASSKKYFNWHRASFSDQELIMMKCSGQHRFPTSSGKCIRHSCVFLSNFYLFRTSV